MTFGQRVVYLCLCGALAVAGLAAYAAAAVDAGGEFLIFSGGIMVGVGLSGMIRAIWAPRVESTGGSES